MRRLLIVAGFLAIVAPGAAAKTSWVINTSCGYNFASHPDGIMASQSEQQPGREELLKAIAGEEGRSPGRWVQAPFLAKLTDLDIRSITAANPSFGHTYEIDDSFYLVGKRVVVFRPARPGQRTNAVVVPAAHVERIFDEGPLKHIDINKADVTAQLSKHLELDETTLNFFVTDTTWTDDQQTKIIAGYKAFDHQRERSSIRVSWPQSRTHFKIEVSGSETLRRFADEWVERYVRPSAFTYGAGYTSELSVISLSKRRDFEALLQALVFHIDADEG